MSFISVARKATGQESFWGQSYSISCRDTPQEVDRVFEMYEGGVYRCNIFDRLGRLVSVIENADFSCGSGIVTNYYYDEIDNLVKALLEEFGE